MRREIEQTSTSIRNLENQTEQVEHDLNEINESLSKLTLTIEKLEDKGDVEVVNSLQINLLEKQNEQEKLQDVINKLSDELEDIQRQIDKIRMLNEESRDELESLQRINEDIQDASDIITQRDTVLHLLSEQCNELRERLGRGITGDTTTYKPRTIPPISEQIKWVDLGIRHVAVQDLPIPEGIHDAADFKKVPMERMKIGILRLQDMQKSIETGIGNNSDYWARFDNQQGLSYVDGYQQVYDAFFGGDAIKVDFDGQKYNIVNGRHRIWLAKKLGVDYLPMRITAKQYK